MYLRFVHARVKREAQPVIQRLYDARILSRLQGVTGCLYGGLIMSVEHPDEVISMTIWDSQANAEAYVKSGLFKELLKEAEPYLEDSSEWKIELSEELELELNPVPAEPVVKSYNLTAQTGPDVPDQDAAPRMYLRVVSTKVQAERADELRSIYEREIIPELQRTKGCRYAYLTEGIEERNEAISITVWDTKKDADAYERSGKFSELLGKVEHTFSDMFQWKMALEREFKGNVITSDDYSVESYSVVTGRRFKH
jgi:heme-degrading monooxygenase HmoA